MTPARESTRIPVAFNEGAADVTATVASAMTAARSAQARWARSPLAQRVELVRELRRLIAENAGQLAEASASARLRPLLESLTAEVLPLAETCRFLERNVAKVLAPRTLGRRGLPLWLSGVRSEIHREPAGVVLIIGPGNYPLLLPGVQLIQALVAGNAVLLKPGVGGSTAAHALSNLLARAGFDPQLVALLPESPEAARAAMLAGPDKVLFTGSAATGEKILAQLAPLLIPATMELSGCDAVIVRADADVDLVVKALLFGLTLNSGATCMSPKRVFVARGIATELEGRLANAIALTPRPRSFTPDFSPVTNPNESKTVSTVLPSRRKAAEAAAHHEDFNTGLKPGVNEISLRLRPLLDDALAHGAHFIAGEIRHDGTITAPIILAGVSPASRLLREDIFAPGLSIVTVTDDHEALLRTNDCPFALTASIFTRDETAARSLAARINAGGVTINDLIIPTADARVPFGGRKRSGFGVTRGAEGLIELTTPKVVTFSRSKFRPAFDTPQPGDAGMFQAYLKFTHGRGLKSRGAGLDTHSQHLRQNKIIPKGNNMTTSRNERIGVIGGGLGGLAAACTLAARGYAVTLFERNEWLGGKATTVEGAGFRFDAGPTIVTIPSVLRRIFTEAGRPMEDYLEMVRLDPQWRCFFDDGSALNLRQDPAQMTGELERFSPGTNSGQRYLDFLKLSERLNDISQRYFFYKPIGGLRDMFDFKTSFDPKVLGDVLAMRMVRSVAGTVRSFTPDARVAQMMDHFTQYVGSSPYGSPAVLCGIAHMQTDEGVWYPMGGTRAVPVALEKLARELGVEIRTNTHIVKILTSDGEYFSASPSTGDRAGVRGRVTGVRTNHGEEIPLRAVVSNCDSVRTHRELINVAVGAKFEKRRSYEAACSGVVLYLGLKKRYDHLAHHDFVFSRDPQEEFEWIYKKGEPAPDPTCYLAATTCSEPATAPAGGEALYVLVHTPYLRPHHDWKKMLPAYRKTIIEKLKRTGGMPDIEERIVFERTLTPQDINDRYHVLNGAIYGLASHGKFLGAFKPGNRSPDLRGLYLAGGAAHPGPGMPMVLMSGWIAADALDQDGVSERATCGASVSDLASRELVGV